MTKTLILIAILLAIVYFYWKYQSKTISSKFDKEEVFYDAEGWKLDSDKENHD